MTWWGIILGTASALATVHAVREPSMLMLDEARVLDVAVAEGNLCLLTTSDGETLRRDCSLRGKWAVGQPFSAREFQRARLSPEGGVVGVSEDGTWRWTDGREAYTPVETVGAPQPPPQTIEEQLAALGVVAELAADETRWARGAQEVVLPCEAHGAAPLVLGEEVWLLDACGGVARLRATGAVQGGLLDASVVNGALQAVVGGAWPAWWHQDASSVVLVALDPDTLTPWTWRQQGLPLGAEVLLPLLVRRPEVRPELVARVRVPDGATVQAVHRHGDTWLLLGGLGNGTGRLAAWTTHITTAEAPVTP